MNVSPMLCLRLGKKFDGRDRFSPAPKAQRPENAQAKGPSNLPTLESGTFAVVQLSFGCSFES